MTRLRIDLIGCFLSNSFKYHDRFLEVGTVSFSSEWDDAYQRNEHQSVWPWSNLVSRCLRHTRLKYRDPAFRVLELGCGAGANIPFFLEYGADYHGVEGSQSAVKSLQARFPTLKAKLVAGDFTESLFF
jgi:SAM-dependent methyltransferase